MTPKPANLPADPRDMTPAQIIAEAARALRNAGGERYGAGGIANGWLMRWRG